MRPPQTLGAFFLSATLLFLVLTLLWSTVSVWTSIPVAGIVRIGLAYGAPDWVRRSQVVHGRLEVETRIAVKLAPEEKGNGSAVLIVEVDPAKHAYGLPLYLALLLASRSRRIVRRAAMGYCILLPLQAYGVLMDVLKEIIVTGGSPVTLGISQWQLEAIALGYQFGSLILPALAPLILWLWFERAFVAALMVDSWMQRTI